MSSRAFYKFSVLAILFLLFLSPTIFIPGFIGIRLEEIYICFFAVIVLFVHKEDYWRFKIPLRVVLLLLFSLLIILSIFFGALLSLPATLADLTKLIWLIKSVAIYIIFFNYINNEESGKSLRIDFVLRYFIKFAAISAFICFQQYFDLFNLNSFYIPIIAPTQYLSLMPGYSSPRVIGMLGNPNVQGFVLSLAIVAFIYIFLKSKELVSLFTLFVLIVALLMTLSRGALVALAVGSIFLFITYKKDIRFAYIKILVCFVFLVIFYYGYQLTLENETLYNAMMFRFEHLENALEDESFVSRFDVWNANISYFKSSPIFGVGLLPRATELSIGADNEWLYFLRSFGVVGIIWLIVFLFAPIFLKRNKSLESKNLTRFVLSILLLSTTYMIPAAVILSPVTFPFLLVLLSISDRSVTTLKYRITNRSMTEVSGLNSMVSNH